jgi:hypothetical protein
VSNARVEKLKQQDHQENEEKTTKLMEMKTKYKYSLCLMYDFFCTNYLRIFFFFVLFQE